MDSAALLNYYWTDPTASLVDDLAIRYGPECSFNPELQNIWSNYYVVKANALGPDVQGTPSPSGVLPRTVTAKDKVDDLISIVDPALASTFASILQGLDSIKTLVDPKYGLIAGLNCRIIGEDFQRTQQSLCGSLYTNLYATRLALGIASYAILLALCLFSCTARKKQYYKVLEHSHESQEQIQPLNPYSLP
jgi:hypothetical protein